MGSPTPAQTWHEHELRVRYGETDQMGVVYHANYLIYMEEGRTRLMESLGCSYAELERKGWALVVRKASLRYRAPARYDERLVVRTRVAGHRAASVEFAYEVCSEDRSRLAEGTTELACVDLSRPGRPPCVLPDELRALVAGS